MPEAEDFSVPESIYIEMPSGEFFYMADPHFNIDDIAYSLGGKPRYNSNGARHPVTQHTVSVAEHSVRVSYLIQEEGGDPLEGLLHDVTEAYLGDMPGPWKAILPDYVKLEGYLWEHFVRHMETEYKRFLPVAHTAALKRADWRSLMIEAKELMHNWRTWEVVADDMKPTIADPPCYWWLPDEAEAQFLRRFHELTWDPDNA